MRLFFDESGNSGTDVYDLSQPVLAYGGAWLDASNESHFQSYLGSLRARHNLQGSGELKGRVLIRSPRGRAAVAEVLRELVTREVPVSLLGVYKPYFGPGVLVDDCTDPVYNSEFDESWLSNTNATVPLVQAIHDAADPALMEAAWRARDGDDVVVLKSAYRALLAQLSQHADRELAATAQRMACADLDELWACGEIERKKGMGYSPNLSGFNAMVQGCEEQAEQLGVRDVELVHDQQGEFQTAFAFWWGALNANAPSRAEFVYPTGNVQRFAVARLTKLVFVDSTNEVGVQLADVLASALRVAMYDRTSSLAGRTDDYLDALRQLCAVRERSGGFPFFIGTYRWQREMLSMLNLAPGWSLDTSK